MYLLHQKGNLHDYRDLNINMFLMVFIALRPVLGIKRALVYGMNDQQNGFLHVLPKAVMLQCKQRPGLVRTDMQSLLISICKSRGLGLADF